MRCQRGEALVASGARGSEVEGPSVVHSFGVRVERLLDLLGGDPWLDLAVPRDIWPSELSRTKSEFGALGRRMIGGDDSEHDVTDSASVHVGG